MNAFNKLLSQIDPSLETLSGAPLWMFLLALALTIVFLVGYAFKGTQVILQLRKAISGVKATKKLGKAPPSNTLRTLFPDEPLRHLWEEYEDTLHAVKRASSGASELVEIRATVPAETLFTSEVLVDSRLFDNFTRHLPGILTGLGIIGTFGGLLQGLKLFDPSSTETAVAGLKPLLDSVSHAFAASGTAIACAMFVVFFSRLVLAYCYRLVEQLSHGIDSLYSTGAGEEYLARLVSSSEQNQANTAQLKDALVEDLRKMMTELVDKQIAAQNASSKDLGNFLGGAISDSLKGPMAAIQNAISDTTKNNSTQVAGMLESLLTGFMAKLEDTFGGQMRGINEQMQKSIDAMSSVQQSLQTLLSDVKEANENATTQLTGTLEEAMRKSAENQQVLTDQMRAFVQEFKNIVDDERNKSKGAMDEAMAKVLSDLSNAIAQMEKVRTDAAGAEKKRSDDLHDGTKVLVGGLSGQVDKLLNAVSEQVIKTQQNIDAIGDVSTRAVDGMNQGALTMGAAANRFETAGNSVSSAIDKAGKLSETLNATASSLQSAAQAVKLGFDQYDSTRKTVDLQVASLMGLIESAKKEAGISQELVKNITASANSLKNAEAASREHLEQVNAALVKAFETFGSSLVEMVRKSVGETDKHVGKGMETLSGVVQGLVQAVQKMSRN
jgi:hypothetical protein